MSGMSQCISCSVALASYTHLLSPLMTKSMLPKSLHLSCGDRKTKNVRMGATEMGPDSKKTSGEVDPTGAKNLLEMHPTLSKTFVTSRCSLV